MTILIRRCQFGDEAVYDGSDGTAASRIDRVGRRRHDRVPHRRRRGISMIGALEMSHQLGPGFVPSAHRASRSHRLGLLTTTWTVLSTILRVWIVRSRQRRALSRLLDDRDLLKDIGVSQEEALHEAEKAFWRR
jgi:uncharacterized protein YjiS (DUF1127 family)